MSNWPTLSVISC